MARQQIVRLTAIPGVILALLVALFVCYPLVRMVLATILPGDKRVVLQAYAEAFANPTVLSAIWGSIWLTAASLLFGVPLALLLGWITSSTDAPLARALSTLPTLTLALSPLVGAIGWLVLLSPRVGVLNLVIRAVLDLHTQTGPLNAYSLPVIVMLMTFYIVPYIYGPAHAAFLQIDASLQEAGRVCGAGPLATLWTVTIPVLRPAILAGALIGGVMAAAMFAIPLILASGTGLNVLPTQIYYYVNQEGRTGPAMALACLLGAATIPAMLLYFRVLAGARFVTVSGKGARSARVRLGLLRWPASAIVLLYLFLALVVPAVSLVYLSLIGFWSSNVFSQKLSFAQYRALIDFPSAMDGLINSFWMSLLASAMAVGFGVAISYRRLRRPHLGNRVLAFFAALPLGVPSIALGLAFLIAFAGGPLPLYGTAALMVIAYTVHVLPMAMRNSDAGLRQLSPELEEAALVCGDTRSGVLLRILVPIMRQPLLAVAGLAFITLYRDISISILLYTPATTPSSVALLGIFDEGSITGAAAYSVVVTIISTATVALVIWASHSRTA
jgi:iron(III) transport system permease protein